MNNPSEIDPGADRIRLAKKFLAENDWPDATLAVLADDASFRRYFTVGDRTRRAVLMDAPPDKEATEPFARIARFLALKGFSAPAILAEDRDAGFLLIEDFGADTYTRLLNAGADEQALYSLATDTLIALHQTVPDGTAPRALVPVYDWPTYWRELSLLTDWYWPAVMNKPCPEDVRAEFETLWRRALDALDAGSNGGKKIPNSLVLRDFHVDNMIRLPDRPGTAACGLLDFQDALVGPVAYDLVSLLEDARRDVPEALARAMKARYLAAFPDLDQDMFMAAYAALGVQRSVKILGIFTRLDRRDGKPTYLRHIPRVWRWIEGGLRHPDLSDIRAWFDRSLPPDTRITPEAATR